MSRSRSLALTAAQVAALQDRADGFTYREIAARRGRPKTTIRGQLEQAHIKLGAKTSLNAVAIAIRKGLIK